MKSVTCDYEIGYLVFEKKSFGIWSFFKIVFSLKNKAFGILSSINARIKDELAEKIANNNKTWAQTGPRLSYFFTYLNSVYPVQPRFRHVVGIYFVHYIIYSSLNTDQRRFIYDKKPIT